MNNNPNYKKGIRREIILLLYENTAVSYTALKIASKDWKNTHKKLREMERDGIISIDHCKKQDIDSMVTLKNYKINKQIYEPYLSVEYHDGYEMESVQHINIVKQKKYMRDSEVMCAARYANILTLRTEKVLLDKPEQAYKKIDRSHAYFYSSKEIKNCINGDHYIDYDKISFTRINGVIISAGGIYPVYNIRTNLIEWSKSSEIKTQHYIRHILELRMEGCEAQNRYLDINSTVIMVKDMKLAVRMIAHDSLYYRKMASKKRINATPLIGIDYTYEHMYVLTQSSEDLKLLEIMTTPSWEIKMKSMYLNKESREESKMTSIVCDGVKNGTYIYFFCIPDIVRFKQFVDRVTREETPDKFVVYCFRHQKAFVEAVVGPYVKIKTTDINKLYEEYMSMYKNELSERGEPYFHIKKQ